MDINRLPSLPPGDNLIGSVRTERPNASINLYFFTNAIADGISDEISTVSYSKITIIHYMSLGGSGHIILEGSLDTTLGWVNHHGGGSNIPRRIRYETYMAHFDNLPTRIRVRLNRVSGTHNVIGILRR